MLANDDFRRCVHLLAEPGPAEAYAAERRDGLRLVAALAQAPDALAPVAQDRRRRLPGGARRARRRAGRDDRFTLGGEALRGRRRARGSSRRARRGGERRYACRSACT